MRAFIGVILWCLIVTHADAACTLKLTSAGGRPVTVVASQVAGIMDCPECGGSTRTIVNTLGPTYWVRESPEEVSKRLDAALKEGCK